MPICYSIPRRNRSNMDLKIFLNEKYGNLCQTLGDLEYRKALLEQDIQAIRAEIKSLNGLVPQLERYESLVKREKEKTTNNN